MLTVTARHTVVGFHQWPGAPDRRAYLRELHRHEFAVAATVLVDHAERDTEFHDLADVLAFELRSLAEPARTYVDGTSLGGVQPLTFGPRSVETIATVLADALAARGYTPLTVTVSEDGQHDGTWTNDLLLPGRARRILLGDPR